jgi:arginyl-tRNA synthetase
MKDDENIAHQIHGLVKKSEHQDKETLNLIQKAYQPVLEGITESLSTINIHIDSFIPESTFVNNATVDDVIAKLKQTSYSSEDEGALYLDLQDFGIKGRNTKFYLTRGDGTSLYATRDIAYHVWKAKQADLLINILGEDHKLESKQVEICLKLLGETTLPIPVFYAFVSLPGGKMSTRRARVVYLDDLIDECIKRAYQEVKKRRHKDLSEQEMNTIARIIGTGAIRYNIIKVQPEKDIVFKWEEALNFDGNAAPFIQYAHARAAGILSRKAKNLDLSAQHQIQTLVHPSEIALGKKLAMFPQVILEATEEFKPHIITNYLFQTASLFNQFYRDCPVSTESDEQKRTERFILVSAVKIVLSNGLNLLGITAPDEM